MSPLSSISVEDDLDVDDVEIQVSGTEQHEKEIVELKLQLDMLKFESQNREELHLKKLDTLTNLIAY